MIPENIAVFTPLVFAIGVVFGYLIMKGLGKKTHSPVPTIITCIALSLLMKVFSFFIP